MVKQNDFSQDLFFGDKNTLSQLTADNETVFQLYALGLVDRSSLETILEFINSPRHWSLWSYRLLMLTGGLLLLSGIVFFFAANWQEIPPQAKLYGLQAAIAACAVAALSVKLDSILGRFFAISASVLVGVFLAVYGQIYQTGADSWTLFALWAGLILPWVLLSRDPLHGFLWLGIANLAIALFITEFYGNIYYDFAVTCAALAVFNFGVLIVTNALPRKWLGENWSAPWTEMTLLASMALPATLSMATVILNDSISLIGELTGWVSFPLLCFAFIRYRLQRRSPGGSVIVTVALVAVFEAFLLRVMPHSSSQALSTATFMLFINLALLTPITKDLQKLFPKQEIGQ